MCHALGQEFSWLTWFFVQNHGRQVWWSQCFRWSNWSWDLTFLSSFSTLNSQIPLYSWLFRICFILFFEVDTVAFCYRRVHMNILSNLSICGSFHSSWLSFRVFKTQASCLIELTKRYLSRMPFKLFLRSNFLLLI